MVIWISLLVWSWVRWARERFEVDFIGGVLTMKPVTSSVMISLVAPRSSPITGVAEARASRVTMPKGSSKVEGTMRAWALRSRSLSLLP